jgi:TPR repeat protein
LAFFVSFVSLLTQSRSSLSLLVPRRNSVFPFDPLLSVQWYSVASQAGEAEADMVLSKWFLCGAEGASFFLACLPLSLVLYDSPLTLRSGAFDKDESLARTFSAKAAAKGLPSGEFAMGYYNEVGIGGGLDLGEART